MRGGVRGRAGPLASVCELPTSTVMLRERPCDHESNPEGTNRPAPANHLPKDKQSAASRPQSGGWGGGAGLHMKDVQAANPAASIFGGYWQSDCTVAD